MTDKIKNKQDINVFRDSQRRHRRGRKEERWCVEYFGNELVIVRAAPHSRRKAKDNHIRVMSGERK